MHHSPTATNNSSELQFPPSHHVRAAITAQPPSVMPSRMLKFGRPHLAPNNSDLAAEDTLARQSSVTEHKLPHSAMDIFHHAKEKRHSLTGGGRVSPAPKNSPKNSPRITPVKPAKLEIEVESPPLVFYGTPSQSSGALFSGQLLLKVLDPEIELKTFEMSLIATVTTKKPVSKDCPNCTTKTNDLKKWVYLTEPARFPKVGAPPLCLISTSYILLIHDSKDKTTLSCRLIFELLLHMKWTKSRSPLARVSQPNNPAIRCFNLFSMRIIPL